MGSAKVMFPIVSQPPAPSLLTADSSACPVALRVTTDVHVYRYNDSQSSVDECSSRVVVVTSLSAIVKGLSTTNMLTNDDEYLAGPSEKPSVSFDVYSHPVVRRSKKGMCLNVTDVQRNVDVQSTISRMVLLPYPGCSGGNSVKVASENKSFVKSSRTWELVNSSWKRSGQKRTYSQILNPHAGKKKTHKKTLHTGAEFDAFFNSEDFCMDNLIESVPDMSRQNLKQTLSESQILFKDERSRMYICSPLDDVSQKKSAPLSYVDRSDIGASLAGFEQGIFAPQVKSTRNVSILHRPRTRHKATSTTSLDKYFGKKEQNLDESIKGVLMPYISAGNYPSELLLKLVPKKKIEEEMKKEEHVVEDGSTRTSEENLLAPKLDDAKVSKKSKKSSKKKTKCGLFCCLSKSKKDDSDNESVVTRVYYPSIVEVHEGKNVKNSVKEIDSDFTFILEGSRKSINKR